MNYYQILYKTLGVDSESSEEEIRTKYDEKMQEYEKEKDKFYFLQPPDPNSSIITDIGIAITKLKKAYEIVSAQKQQEKNNNNNEFQVTEQDQPTNPPSEETPLLHQSQQSSSLPIINYLTDENKPET